MGVEIFKKPLKLVDDFIEAKIKTPNDYADFLTDIIFGGLGLVVVLGTIPHLINPTTESDIEKPVPIEKVFENKKTNSID